MLILRTETNDGAANPCEPPVTLASSILPGRLGLNPVRPLGGLGVGKRLDLLRRDINRSVPGRCLDEPRTGFQAATLSNAQALKLDRDIGTVQVGKRASLLLVRADPTKTVHAYQEIVKVILGGRVLDPQDLAARPSL
jgi:cytosine/adenosine deaminase-related metal-dependent hydrolase